MLLLQVEEGTALQAGTKKQRTRECPTYEEFFCHLGAFLSCDMMVHLFSEVGRKPDDRVHAYGICTGNLHAATRK